MNIYSILWVIIQYYVVYFLAQIVPSLANEISRFAPVSL